MFNTGTFVKLMKICIAGVTLNVPVGKWKTKVFTKEECIESEKISSARAVVERAFRHVKVFKILKGPVSRKLLPYVSKLFFFICHITNLEPCHVKAMRLYIESLEIEDRFKGLTLIEYYTILVKYVWCVNY